MSQAPHVIRGLRDGLKLGQGKLEDSLWEALLDPYCGCTMALTAENCAAKYEISREAQDCYALRSQQLADAAWKAGRFVEEIVPVEIKTRKGVQVVDRDDHMRPDDDDGGARQAAAGVQEGRHRHGGQRQRDRRRRRGADPGVARGRRTPPGSQPLGRLVGWAATGVEPSLMGMGPAPATRKALAATGLSLDDIDLIEVNEAFAGQYLAVEKELGLDRDKVNVNGGAIALGHPLGMSGTRLMLTLLLELRRRGKKRGLATACIGGGQGIAAIVETVAGDSKLRRKWMSRASRSAF